MDTVTLNLGVADSELFAKFADNITSLVGVNGNFVHLVVSESKVSIERLKLHC